LRIAGDRGLVKSLGAATSNSKFKQNALSDGVAAGRQKNFAEDTATEPQLIITNY